MSQKNLPLDAATVHVVALAYLKENAPEVIMAGFKACETWCQQLLLDLNLVRRKCTTQAAKLPADIQLKKERLSCQVCLCLLCSCLHCRLQTDCWVKFLTAVLNWVYFVYFEER
jgi:hypothetical protein